MRVREPTCVHARCTLVSMLGNFFVMCFMADSSCFSERQDGRVLGSPHVLRMCLGGVGVSVGGGERDR